MKKLFFVFLLLVCSVSVFSKSKIQFDSEIKFFLGEIIDGPISYNRYTLKVTLTNKDNPDFVFYTESKEECVYLGFDKNCKIPFAGSFRFFDTIILKKNESYTFFTNNFLIPKSLGERGIITATFGQLISPKNFDLKKKAYKPSAFIKNDFNIYFDKNKTQNFYPVFPLWNFKSIYENCFYYNQ